MTRRKRGRNSAIKPIVPEASMPEVVMPEKTSYEPKRDVLRAATLKDIPLNELSEIAKQHAEVSVTIRRRNSKGQLASLGYAGIVLTPEEVTRIADWIEPRSGGGVYCIDVTSTSDRYTKICPSFEIAIEAPPKPPISVHVPLSAIPKMPPGFQQPAGVSQMPYDPMQPIQGAISHNDIPRIPGVSPVAVPTNWLNGLPYDQRAAYASGQVQLPPGASIASDQLAVEALRRAEARSAELEAKLTAMLQRSEERERTLQEQLREEREKAREQMHQLQIQMLREQMALQNNKQPERSAVQEYAPLVTALAPVLAAMVNANKESSTKSLELQQQGMQQLLGLIVAQGNKPQPDPLAVVEKLGPLLQLGQKDPAANIAMMEAMGNMQLQMTGMAAQMIESLGQQAAGDSTPAWLPIVQTIAAGIMQMSQAQQADQQRQAMMAAQQRQLGMGAMQQPQQSRPQAPVVQATPPTQHAPGPVPYHTDPPSTPAPVVAPAPIKLNPAMLDLLPTEFRTPEWKGIIVGLHERKAIDEVSTVIARHIGHLDEFGLLPTVLHDYHLNPQTALRALVQPLPIYAADRVYCEEVIERTVQAMLDHGVLQLAAQDEEAHEDEAGHEEEEHHEDDAVQPSAMAVLAATEPVGKPN